MPASLFSPEKIVADISTGSALGLINDWGLVFANLLIIGGRVLIEYLILKRNKNTNDKGTI